MPLSCILWYNPNTFVEIYLFILFIFNNYTVFVLDIISWSKSERD